MKAAEKLMIWLYILVDKEEDISVTENCSYSILSIKKQNREYDDSSFNYSRKSVSIILQRHL